MPLRTPAVIYSWYAARLIWQQRLYGEPLPVAEFVAQISPFWRLESFSSRGGDVSSDISGKCETNSWLVRPIHRLDRPSRPNLASERGEVLKRVDAWEEEVGPTLYGRE